MKVTWHANDLTKQSRLTAEPGEYDGSPVMTDLVIDWVASNHAIDARVAVAGALTYHGFLSGDFEVPSPVMPQLATSINALSFETEVIVHPVVYAPNKIEQGNITLALNPGGEYLVDTSFRDFDTPRVIDLRIMDSAQLAGMSLEPLKNILRVPSNAWLHTALREGGSGESEQSISKFMPFIAVAILMGHDLDAGSILLPHRVAEDQLFLRVAELLRVVGFLLTNPI